MSEAQSETAGARQSDSESVAQIVLSTVDICLCILDCLDVIDRVSASQVNRAFDAASRAPRLWAVVSTEGWEHRRGVDIPAGLRHKPIHSLTIAGKVGLPADVVSDAWIANVLQQISTERLKVLDLRHTGAGKETANFIAQNGLPALQSLDMRGCLKVPRTVVACRTIEVFRSGFEMEFGSKENAKWWMDWTSKCKSRAVKQRKIKKDRPIKYGGVTATHSVSAMPELRELELHALSAPGDVVPLLDASTKWTKLSKLTLTYAANLALPGADGPLVDVLIARLPLLTVLNLRMSQLSKNTLSAIGQTLPRLTELNISGAPHVTNEGLRSVATGCPHLSLLDLSYCIGRPGTTATMAGVLDVADKLDLTRLGVSGFANCRDVDVERIVASCPRLVAFAAGNCKRLSNIALKALATKTPELQKLVIHQMEEFVTLEGVIDLVIACPNLRSLHAEGSFFTEGILDFGVPMSEAFNAWRGIVMERLPSQRSIEFDDPLLWTHRD